MKALLTLLMIGGCSTLIPAQTSVDDAALVVKEKSVDNRQGQLSMAVSYTHLTLPTILRV